MYSPIGDPHNWHDISELDNSGLNINMHVDPIHAWQELTPVCVEGLLQLTLGAPMHISHGGLQFAQVRYYDGQRRRPGLPHGVSALVSHFDQNTITLTLVNSDALHAQSVIIQAGSFAEHQITHVKIASTATPVNKQWLDVDIAPGSGATLTITVQRYQHAPSYVTPWHNPPQDNQLIRSRQA